MTLFLAVVGLPFLAALACAFLGRRRLACAALATGTFVADLLLLRGWLPEVLAGDTVLASRPWIDELGLSVAFMADGLGLLMAAIITGIGALVSFYAYHYLEPEEPAGRFYAWLLAFGGAMVGLVLSDNLLLLYMFWELTSLTSFFLIGWWHAQADARRGALHALTVTVGGGLCLLAGIVLLALAGGSFEVSQLVLQAEAIRQSPLYLPALVLLLLGAFTKSAQFPFHFWLPGAMTAPTPISTYLHSATMVKAGVFLVARLFPVLSGTDAWFLLLTVVGMTTMVVGSVLALLVWDLKQILAYSTISQLGLLTAGFGVAGVVGLSADLFQILNHALYKSSLFMLAGFVDHLKGTRDLRRLGGLVRESPVAMVATALAALSLAGIPPMAGFLGKEYFVLSLLELRGAPGAAGGAWWLLLPGLVVVAGACNLAYAAKLGYGIFFAPPEEGAQREPQPACPNPAAEHDPPGEEHGPDFEDDHGHGHAPRAMLLPPALLSLTCLLLGVFPGLLQSSVMRLGIHGAEIAPPQVSFAFWHHLDGAFLVSLGVLVVGPLLYRGRDRIAAWGHARLGHLSGAAALDALLEGLLAAAGRATDRVHDGRLDVYLTWTALLLFGAAAGLAAGGLQLPVTPSLTGDHLVEAILWVLLATTAIGTALVRHNFGAMMVLGLTGILVSVMLILFRAPDLALTQLLVETATLVLVLTVVRVLPRTAPHPPKRRAWRVPAAILGGVFVALMAWSIRIPGGAPGELAGYYGRASYQEAGARNVVNAILVDFRGFDTMGEVTVLLAALLCVMGLWAPAELGRKEMEAQGKVDCTSVQLGVATPVISAVVVLFGVYFMLRGHHLPGGGFIGALVVVAGVFLNTMTFGPRPTVRALHADPIRLAGAGLLISAGTGAAAMLLGRPFLTQGALHAHVPLLGELHLPTAAIFDGGIFLLVIGVSTVLLLALMRGAAHRREGERSDW